MKKLSSTQIHSQIRALETSILTSRDATDRGLWQLELDAYCAELARRGEEC